MHRQVCQLKTVSTEGFTPKPCGQFVDRIYSIGLLRDGTKCENMQKPQYFLGGCNLFKGKTYVFARPRIRDREGGGSNPLAPTIFPKKKATRLSGLSRLCRFLCRLVYCVTCLQTLNTQPFRSLPIQT